MHPREAIECDFDPDEDPLGNVVHLAAHGILPVDVEDVFWGNPVWAPSKPPRPGRWRMIGFTLGGTALTIVVALTGDGKVRPITGWSPTLEEQHRYLSQHRRRR